MPMSLRDMSRYQHLLHPHHMFAILRQSFGLPLLRHTELIVPPIPDGVIPSHSILSDSLFMSPACRYKLDRDIPGKKHLRSISVSTLDTRDLRGISWKNSPRSKSLISRHTFIPQKTRNIRQQAISPASLHPILNFQRPFNDLLQTPLGLRIQTRHVVLVINSISQDLNLIQHILSIPPNVLILDTYRMSQWPLFGPEIPLKPNIEGLLLEDVAPKNHKYAASRSKSRLKLLALLASNSFNAAELSPEQYATVKILKTIGKNGQHPRPMRPGIDISAKTAQRVIRESEKVERHKRTALQYIELLAQRNQHIHIAGSFEDVSGNHEMKEGLLRSIE